MITEEVKENLMKIGVLLGQVAPHDKELYMALAEAVGYCDRVKEDDMRECINCDFLNKSGVCDCPHIDKCPGLQKREKKVNTTDILTVAFDSSLNDAAILAVSRKCGEDVVVLKLVFGEQADILYHLLTEQWATAEIKLESEE